MAEDFLAPIRYEVGDLVIRCYCPEDADELHTATTESFDHLRPWMDWAKKDNPVEDTIRVVRKLIAGYMKGEDYTLGVWQQGRLVAGTGFHMRCGPVAWKVAEIGMWVRADSSGRGLGTKILHHMLEWGFTEWGWERLIWKCETVNFASARVAEKCGMTLEATFRSDAIGADGNRRDTHQYAILRPDWEAQRRLATQS